MALSEFRDTLSRVILHFGGTIGNKSPYDEISLIRRRRRRFFYFALW